MKQAPLLVVSALVVLLAAGIRPMQAATPPAHPSTPAGSVSQASTPVIMDAADRDRMGVSTRTLAASTRRARVPAIVRVLDPMPLATLQGELETAAANAAASEAEFRRTSGLAAQDNSASRQALEAAQARAVADAASSAQLQRRLILEWTPALGRMADDARQALVADLALGKAVLLRADAPTRPDGLEGRIQVSLDADSAPVVAEPLGLGRTADPRMQTVGLFGVVRSPVGGLPPGRVVAGSIESGEVVEGVVLPRSALVRLDGSVWAYVATGDDSFVRREVIDAETFDDGWFVTEGFLPGAQIVDHGAGSLVAVERNDEAATVD